MISKEKNNNLFFGNNNNNPNDSNNNNNNNQNDDDEMGLVCTSNFKIKKLVLSGFILLVCFFNYNFKLFIIFIFQSQQI